MSSDPYRPTRSPSAQDAELARLAAEGQRRIVDAKAKAAAGEDQERRREDNVRAWLGAYYGRPLWTASYVVMALAIPGVIAWIVTNQAGFSASVLLIVAGIVIRLSARPFATRARVAAERAWVASLAFPMQGYFEALAADPMLRCEILVDIDFQSGPAPDAQTVQGLMGLLDTSARVDAVGPGKITIRSGTIDSGRIESAGALDVLPYRDVVAYVHRFVSTVLDPVHRTQPVANVSVRCEEKGGT